MSSQAPAPATSRATFLRFAAVCGVAGAALFTLDWIVAGIFEGNYDNFRQDISDFGALTASHPLPYNIALSVSGALTFVLALGLFAALRRGRPALAGSVALAAFGVGDFLDGLLREDCSPSGDSACRAAIDAGRASWHHQAHDIESFFTITASILAPLLLAFAFRRLERWRDLYGLSLSAAAVSFVAVAWYAVLFLAQDGSSYSGLLERAAVLAFTMWNAAVAWRLYSTA